MTAEKALDYLNSISDIQTNHDDTARVWDALNMAREALTKTIVCAPDFAEEEGTFECSVCKRIVKKEDRFCCGCGQKLKA